MADGVEEAGEDGSSQTRDGIRKRNDQTTERKISGAEPGVKESAED